MIDAQVSELLGPEPPEYIHSVMLTEPKTCDICNEKLPDTLHNNTEARELPCGCVYHTQCLVGYFKAELEKGNLFYQCPNN